MNYIKCKECNKEYDYNLQVCPYCGYKNKVVKNKRILKCILYILVIYFSFLTINQLIFEKNVQLEYFRIVFSNDSLGNIAYYLNLARNLGTSVFLLVIILSKNFKNANFRKSIRILSIILLIIFQILPLIFRRCVIWL